MFEETKDKLRMPEKDLRAVANKTFFRSVAPITTVHLEQTVIKDGKAIVQNMNVPRSLIMIVQDTDDQTILKLSGFEGRFLVDLGYGQTCDLLNCGRDVVDVRPYLSQPKTIVKAYGRALNSTPYYNVEFLLSDVDWVPKRVPSLIGGWSYIALLSRDIVPNENKYKGFCIQMPQSELMRHLREAQKRNIAVLDLTDVNNVKYIQGAPKLQKTKSPSV